MVKIYHSILFIFFLYSCSLSPSLEKATVTYLGFDFSKKIINAEPSLNDIITILDYNPSLQTIQRDGNIYFLTTEISKNQYITDLGEIPFNLVDRVSSTLFSDSISPPIRAGHIYIIKCKDGFAKVFVHSFGGETLLQLKINLIYEFSEDSVF